MNNKAAIISPMIHGLREYLGNGIHPSSHGDYWASRIIMDSTPRFKQENQSTSRCLRVTGKDRTMPKDENHLPNNGRAALFRYTWRLREPLKCLDTPWL
jgi:hypothetical protein